MAEDEQPFENVMERIRSETNALKNEYGRLLGKIEDVITKEKRGEIRSSRESIDQLLQSVERALEKLDQHHRRLGTLHAAIAMINRVTDLKVRLEAILDLAIEIVGADCGFLILYNEKTRKIIVSLQRGMAGFDESSGDVETQAARSPTPSFSIARDVLKTRKTAMVTAIRDESPFDEDQGAMLQGAFAVICSPMVFDDRLIGLLYVDFREVDPVAARRIGRDDREMFESLASLAANAIQIAKFFRNQYLQVERRSNRG